MNKRSQILDELLVLKAQQGDKKAIEMIVERWNKNLIYQSYLQIDDWEEAKDIVQDVWRWVVSNLGKLKDPTKFGSWIRTVVNRRSIDWIRQQQRRRKHKAQIQIEYGDSEITNADDGDSFGVADSTNENRLSALSQAIGQLPKETRVILNLYYQEANSIATIAEVMNLPAGTVKSKLFYAREKLKKLLEN